MVMRVFAVYVDVRYEAKGTFSPDVKYNSHSYREFNGYVIVAKNSNMELTINEPLRHFITVVVLFNFFIFDFCNICYSPILA